MPPAEQPRGAGPEGRAPDGRDARPPRPYSREDLFRPQGPLTGRPGISEDSTPTAERPAVPGEPPRPRRARAIGPGPAPSAGPAAAPVPGATAQLPPAPPAPRPTPLPNPDHSQWFTPPAAGGAPDFGPTFGPGGQDRSTYAAPPAPDDEEPRGRLRGLLAGVLVLGLVAAAVAVSVVVLLGGDRDDVGSAAGTTRPTGAPQATGPGGSAGPTTTSDAGSPVPADVSYEPVPDEPWEDDLDFGYLTEVFTDGADVVLVVNRANFFHGEAAELRNGGVAPPGDFLVEDSNPRLRRFTLLPQAPVRGSTRLGGPDAGEDGAAVERADFVARATAAIGSAGDGLPVWLRHAGGEDGPVSALAEQYVP